MVEYTVSRQEVMTEIMNDGLRELSLDHLRISDDGTKMFTAFKLDTGKDTEKFGDEWDPKETNKYRKQTQLETDTATTHFNIPATVLHVKRIWGVWVSNEN